MLQSALTMLCSSKAYYFIVILAIFFTKVESESEDDNTLAEDNAFGKEDNSEYVHTNDASYGVNETEQEDENIAPDNDKNDQEKPFIYSINEKVEYGVLKEKCLFFKHGREVDLDQMSDVWQVVYFQLKEDVSCFKIYIKKTSNEEKRAYSEKYGSFSNKVNWTVCDLEIRGNDKSETQRRHFLQRRNKGIMDNVIILEHNGRENSTYTLHPESSDQWLVVNNLLLMRDCNDGDVVVFRRVPYHPRRNDIRDALAMFGEYTMKGKMPCK